MNRKGKVITISVAVAALIVGIIFLVVGPATEAKPQCYSYLDDETGVAIGCISMTSPDGVTVEAAAPAPAPPVPVASGSVRCPEGNAAEMLNEMKCLTPPNCNEKAPQWVPASQWWCPKIGVWGFRSEQVCCVNSGQYGVLKVKSEGPGHVIVNAGSLGGGETLGDSIFDCNGFCEFRFKRNSKINLEAVPNPKPAGSYLFMWKWRDEDGFEMQSDEKPETKITVTMFADTTKNNSYLAVFRAPGANGPTGPEGTPGMPGVELPCATTDNCTYTLPDSSCESGQSCGEGGEFFTACMCPVSTVTPTETPTQVPTVVPTDTPTETPTEVPVDTPTEVPTDTPTEVPTVVPTEVPTDTPTEVPTVVPTVVPTSTPTSVPTSVPTGVPTVVPTGTLF